MSLFKKSLIKKSYKYKLLEDGISKEDILKAKNVLDSKQITMEHPKQENSRRYLPKKWVLNMH